MTKNFFSTRKIPDPLLEEIVTALLSAKSFEFKSLFAVVHAALKGKNRMTGGEEMLRLRAYEKLQNLVREGGATKTDGRYAGMRKQLLVVEKE